MLVSAIGWWVREVRRKELENIVMANMSEWMRSKTLLFVRYFTLSSELDKYKTLGILCERKQSQNVFIIKTDSFARLLLSTPRYIQGIYLVDDVANPLE